MNTLRKTYTMFGRMHHARHGCGHESPGGRHGWRGRGPDGDDGRRMRRFFEQGDLRLVILALIAEAPRHGYELIREIEERVGGAYAPSPGVIYPTLTLLEDTGLIEAEATTSNRKRYAITDAGRAQLAEQRANVDSLMARMGEVRRERERGDFTPVMRAMANLRTAMRLRMARGGVTAETVRAVAALIDEVAAKVDGV